MYKHKDLTQKIIQAYYEVYNELGTGFLESVYEKAIYHVLTESLYLKVKSQVPITVHFRERVVGTFLADLLVEEKVLVELKAVSILLPQHQAQVINYLKATELEIGLLMNFGDRPQFKRLIFDKK